MNEIQIENNVLIGTPDNFGDIVTENEYVLIYFYAPWSGHCQTLDPEYAKAATTLMEEASGIKLVKIDAIVETKLTDKYQVKGFPTLMLFRNGDPIDSIEHPSGLTAAGILDWVKKKSGLSTIRLDTPEAARAFIEGSDVVVVGFFADQESGDAQVFIDLANSMNGVAFGICANAEAAEACGVAPGSLTVFNKARTTPCTAESGLDQEALRSFVEIKATPLVTEYSEETAAMIFGQTLKNFLILCLSKQAEDAEVLIAALRDAAETLEGRVRALVLNTDIDDTARMIEFFRISNEDLPAVRLIRIEGDIKKYIMDAPYTAENYRAFVTAWEAGAVALDLMSEDIPEVQDGPIYRVVGKSFDDAVRHSGKNVFVHFFASWSGHCKQLAPVWAKLAETYADNDSIRIATMDSTANEAPGIKIVSFPTIIYFSAEGEVIDYTGSRTFEDFVQFLHSVGAV